MRQSAPRLVRLPVAVRCDGRVKTFLRRPIEGDWPYLWLDAAYGTSYRLDAVIVAMAVNTGGRREVLGMTIGNSKAEPF